MQKQLIAVLAITTFFVGIIIGLIVSNVAPDDKSVFVDYCLDKLRQIDKNSFEPQNCENLTIVNFYAPNESETKVVYEFGDNFMKAMPLIVNMSNQMGVHK